MKRNRAITGRVVDAVWLTYRTPAETVRALLPEGLELVERGPWAFWDVSVERVDRIRHIGMPPFCGTGFTRVSYRLRAQAMTDRAEVMRGGYETRCDLDRRAAMRFIETGSDEQTHLATIALTADDCGLRCAVTGSMDTESELDLCVAHSPAQLAAGSCFPTTDQARAFCRSSQDKLNIIEHRGRRVLQIQRFQPELSYRSETALSVQVASLGYFKSIDQCRHVALEWASRLGTTPAQWHTGETAGLITTHLHETKRAQAAVCTA